MENFYEHIDDYMNGLLEGEALKGFEAEMERNASLKKAVENYESAKVISEGLLEVDMMETLRRLKEKKGPDENEAQKTDNSIKDNKAQKKGNGSNIKSLNFRRWIAVASFIGVIALVGWWVMELNEEREFRQYVMANYQWPEDLDRTKSVDTIGMNNFEKGKHFFDRNIFEVSQIFLEIHINEESDDQLLSEGYEWLGAVYIHLGKMEQAKNALEKSNEQKAKQNLNVIIQSEK